MGTEFNSDHERDLRGAQSDSEEFQDSPYGCVGSGRGASCAQWAGPLRG